MWKNKTTPTTVLRWVDAEESLFTPLVPALVVGTLRNENYPVVHEGFHVIRGAKGGKDRVVRVSCSLTAELEAKIQRATVVWQADQLLKLPVEVPGELARKYKNAPYSWQWAWLFPAHQPCEHPRAGERVRYRIHEANVQRAVKLSACKLGLNSLATPMCWRQGRMSETCKKYPWPCPPRYNHGLCPLRRRARPQAVGRSDEGLRNVAPNVNVSSPLNT